MLLKLKSIAFARQPWAFAASKGLLSAAEKVAFGPKKNGNEGLEGGGQALTEQKRLVSVLIEEKYKPVFYEQNLTN